MAVEVVSEVDVSGVVDGKDVKEAEGKSETGVVSGGGAPAAAAASLEPKCSLH